MNRSSRMGGIKEQEDKYRPTATAAVKIIRPSREDQGRCFNSVLSTLVELEDRHREWRRARWSAELRKKAEEIHVALKRLDTAIKDFPETEEFVGLWWTDFAPENKEFAPLIDKLRELPLNDLLQQSRTLASRKDGAEKNADFKRWATEEAYRLLSEYKATPTSAGKTSVFYKLAALLAGDHKGIEHHCGDVLKSRK